MLEQKHTPVRPNFSMKGWGAGESSRSDIWSTAQLTPLEGVFKEGLKILDYGCGNGRLFNFISGRLKDFTYYGVEHPDSDGNIEIPKSLFGRDNRFNVDYIDSPFETKAINKVDCVVLGSIFTHLRFSEFERVCDKFKPILERSGVIVFSVFIADMYIVEGVGGAYGVKECYGRVFYTMEQLRDYCKKNDLKIKEYPEYDAQYGANIHRIFKIGV